MAKHTHTSKSPAASAIIVIVGGESLLGKEVREVLEIRAVPAKIQLLATLEEGKVISGQHGELGVMDTLRAEDLMAAKVVILAGSPESSRRAYQLATAAKGQPVPPFIDLSGGLEDNPQARLRAPMAEPAPTPAGPLSLVAHPAASVLALFLRRLQSITPIRRCVVHIFEPASERGQTGLDELQQQTVGLLSFQKLNKEVFDAQASFNMLPKFGEDAPRSLEDIEMTIDRHLASLLSATGPSPVHVPMPSLRVAQAPVFHGYSFSVWVEFERNPNIPALAKALAADPIEVRTKDQEPPSNAGIAGQSGVTAGAFQVDRNDPKAGWFWLVADNLRIAAEQAVEVARGFVR